MDKKIFRNAEMKIWRKIKGGQSCSTILISTSFFFFNGCANKILLPSDIGLGGGGNKYISVEANSLASFKTPLLISDYKLERS